MSEATSHVKDSRGRILVKLAKPKRTKISWRKDAEGILDASQQGVCNKVSSLYTTPKARANGKALSPCQIGRNATGQASTTFDHTTRSGQW